MCCQCEIEPIYSRLDRHLIYASLFLAYMRQLGLAIFSFQLTRFKVMKLLKSFASAIVTVGLVVSSVSLGLQTPAMAKLTNVKLGNLGQSDWDAYCASKINASNDRIIATLADTHVKCQVAISASASNKAEAESNATLAARRLGLQGSITSSIRANSQWNVTFTSYQNSYHLNDWCRKKYSPNLYLPNPFSGEGRIFVGDGGNACYKTENR
jgi:hypothetical protein